MSDYGKIDFNPTRSKRLESFKKAFDLAQSETRLWDNLPALSRRKIRSVYAYPDDFDLRKAE